MAVWPEAVAKPQKKVFRGLMLSAEVVQEWSHCAN